MPYRAPDAGNPRVRRTRERIAAAAKAGCPVSRALAGVPEITLEASLA